MQVTNAINASKYERKAVRLDQAVMATLVVTLVALPANLLVALKIVPVAL